MFGEFIEDFRHYLRFEKRYSPHTLLAYIKDLQQFAVYLAENYPNIHTISAITHFQLRSWLASLKEEQGMNERSINRKMSSLNGYFKFLIRQGKLDKNPVRLLHAMRVPERLPQFLKEQETENLFGTIVFEDGFKGVTDRLILELLYISGMRRHELSSLKESDIEWEFRQIRILGKGNKERLLPVSSALLDELRDYISLKQNEGFADKHLLLLTSGQPLYDGYIYRIVRHYLKQVTSLKKKSPHVLRHTFATHLLNNGAGIQSIKELLGHSSIAATQIYTHINIDELKKVHKLNHPKG